MIRRFWKKGTDFNNVSNEELQDAANKINSMRMKIFNWKPANEVWTGMKKGLLWGKPS